MTTRVREQPSIDRASPNDMSSLATDRGPVPMHLGAILVLGAASDPEFATVRDLLAQRVPTVRRLRQRLVRAPLGCGRPYWVDVADFDLDRHLTHAVLPPPGDVDRLLHVAATMICTRLDPDAPLWSACWVTGLADGGAALILVMHHALADGIGGLAVLGALADGLPPDPAPFVPEPPPSRRELARDATRERMAAVRRVPQTLRHGVGGLRELRLGGAPRLAGRTSLNRPTGDRRRLAITAIDLADVVEAGHARGCTVNDIVLTAVTGALGTVLQHRGEHLDEIVVSVPISGRRSASAEQLGNEVGVVPVAVPLTADPEARLRAIVATTETSRVGRRGSSAGPLGLLFRGLAAVGLAQVFIDHQRLVHTFETNVRGPGTAVRFAGRRVDSLIPMAVNPGNVGVSFDVLSYAGRLVITAVADPEIVPEQDLLSRELADELAALVRP